MTLQLAVAVRNALLDAIESNTGTSAILKIYDLTAGAPADCAAAITGTVLVTMPLPSDWMNDAAGGVKTLAGTWTDTSADDSGTADFFRIFKTDGTTCQMQGTVTATSGGGDMEIDNVVIAAGQTVTVTTFSLTAPNA
jgi:hypothetical protein